TVYPDILLRDYARLIVERFVYEYPDDTTSIDLNILKPPYNSPSIPSKKNIVPIDKLDEICSGTNKILFSMAFETTPHYSYGDFGRYKFQNAIEEFENIDINLIHDYALDFIFNTLGYKERLFGKYDNSFKLNVIPSQNEHCLERIGKKYQWIAFYNILSRISDYYKLNNDYYCKDEFNSNYQGPWLPYVRDFDPTKNIVPIKNNSILSEIRPSIEMFKEFVGKNDTIEMINEWLNNSFDIINNIDSILCCKDKNWVTLYIREFIRNNDDSTSREFFQKKGDQHIEIVANAFIIPIMNKKKFINILNEDNLLNPETKYELFCREFGWSPASKDKNLLDSKYDELNEIDAKPTIQIYRWETEYDNSQTGTIEFYIPSNDLISSLELDQGEKDGFYCDKQGNIIAYDLYLEDNSQPHLIIRKDVLDEYLTKNKLVLMWQIWISKVYYTGDSYPCWAICNTKGYSQYRNNKILKFIEIDKQLNKLNEKNE
ncbi:MAG: hypothetical protein IKP71_04775, partial [Candidatus Riflebacteria bacterium]|nr:hypothetical protein [Candidatus Riflebacteria bacterium]